MCNFCDKALGGNHTPSSSMKDTLEESHIWYNIVGPVKENGI